MFGTDIFGADPYFRTVSVRHNGKIT